MTVDESMENFLSEWQNDNPCVLVHTSGSTGKPKPMMVSKERMRNSARITCDFLGLHEDDTALLCMSLDFIAGKMMMVRALERGMRVISVAPSNHPLATLGNQEITFAAMIPSQVFCSLHVEEERKRLMAIKHLIIGGGAISAELAEALKDFPNNVWSTYGMTETLSHIALRRLSGSEASDWYTPFDNVILTVDANGCLIIDAPLVCEKTLHTNDVCEIRDDGTFRIIGRKDNVVCSGGIKLQIEQIEEHLSRHFTHDFCITKRPDSKFGEVCVLLTEGNADDDFAKCREFLHPYQVPKVVVHVDSIPRTKTGKIDRGTAAQIGK